MDGTGKRAKSLWPVYNALKQVEYGAPREARHILDSVLADLHEYTATPDCWHNTAIVASRVDHEEAEHRLILNGMEEWTEDVDLLCDAFALYTTAGAQANPERARKLWERLQSMGRQKTGPFWRYWCFGAIYFARDLNDSKAALALLDEGLQHVRRDGLMNILTHYRRVLVDSVPLNKLEDSTIVERDQWEALNLLESRYRLGISMGVENGYVLALELAKLCQERAGANILSSSGGNVPHQSNGAAIQNAATQSQNPDGAIDYLERALSYLDLAEKLYTGNDNHQIWPIYEARARVLMAQRRYGEALNVMRSLPEAQRSNPSMGTMLKLAYYAIGQQPPEESGQQSPLEQLFANDGERLEQIARANPQIVDILIHVLRRLSSDDDGGK